MLTPCKIAHLKFSYLLFYRQRSGFAVVFTRGVATGVYWYIYPPNQSTLIFLCGCFVSLTLYTHSNQIPGYAPGVCCCAVRVLKVETRRVLSVPIYVVGHGLSEGERMMISDFNTYCKDVVQHIDIVRNKHPNVPVFIIGYSMVRTAASYTCWL